MAGCPFCDSSSIVKFDSGVTKDSFRCRDCKAEWKVENETGQILSIGGALLTGIFTVFALFGGGDSNSGNYS